MTQQSTFISLRFEKPKKRHNFYPTATLPVLQQSPHIPSTEFSYESLALVDSAKKQLTVDEWKRADAIIKTQASMCRFKPGDRFFPPDVQGFLEYGECCVIGVDKDLKSITNYNDLVWTEDKKTPYIVHARTMRCEDGGKAVFFTCTVGYLRDKAPEIKLEESQQQC